jgi:hypothetical protein
MFGVGSPMLRVRGLMHDARFSIFTLVLDLSSWAMERISFIFGSRKMQVKPQAETDGKTWTMLSNWIFQPESVFLNSGCVHAVLDDVERHVAL